MSLAARLVHPVWLGYAAYLHGDATVDERNHPLDDPACATTRAAVIRQIADVGLCYLHARSAQQAVGMIEELLCR